MDQTPEAKQRDRTSAGGSAATILIVEDSSVQSEMLCRALEAAGYTVITARDGNEGLAAAKANHPAAVLSDINMPGMDGYAMCHAIRREAELTSTPVILLTMLSDPVDVIRGLNAGADAYATKPYNIPGLVSRIESLLAYPPAPPPRVERRKVALRLEGETYLVDAHGPRILNLLISTYENAVLQNRELAATQHALEDLNKHLEQRVAEQSAALKSSEQRFRALLEHASDLVTVVDASGVITYISPSIKQLGGYEPTDVLGENYIGFVHPEDAPAAAAGYGEVLREPGVLHTTEFRFRSKDGSWRILESVARNALADPLIAGVLMNARDVTERVQARQALEQSEREYREVFDSSNDAILIAGLLDGRILDVNKRACESLGRSREQLRQMTLEQIDAPEYAAHLPERLEMLRSRGSAVFESAQLRADGGLIPVEVSAQVIEYRGAAALLAVVRDITERKQAQAALERSARHYRKLMEGGADVFFLIDQSGTMLYRSPSGVQLTGWNDEEVLGKGIVDHIVAEDLPLARSALADTIMHPSKALHAELRLRHKDGTVRDVDITGKNLLADPDVTGIVITARDITERKKAEHALKNSEARYRSYIEVTGQLAWVTAADGTIVEDVPLWRTFTGLSEEQVKGWGWAEALHPDDRERTAQIWREAIARKGVYEAEFRVRRRDGVYLDFFTRAAPVLDASGDVREWIGTSMDITEQKLARRRVADSEAELKSIFEGVVDGIAVMDLQTRRLVKTNSAFGTMLGYGADEIALLSVSDLHPPESLANVMPQFERQMSGEIKTASDLPVKRKDGSVFYADISTTTATIGDKPHMVGVFHDVTERKLAEAALARVNRALRTLSAGNTALVHATDEQELTEQMCRILVEIGGYRLALVGYAESDERRTVRTIAHCVQGNGYVERETVSWADDAAGQGPSGIAIRTARPQIVQDARTDPAYAPWRDHAIRLGYAAVACFPLLDAEQSVFGVLCIYAAEGGGFTQEESDLLAEFAGDLAFGIGSIRVQVAHAHSAALLTRSMEGTIQAMAATVETRDAYTAGHQRRVAELVLAIAGELNMSEDDIHAAHLAAIVHDLGKIQVPAEILSKPGKLLPLEFELIKYHPTSGYNILKDVDFPWPIAEIVYQHHERLDGSGYPRGLKGDEILLAAKILAVADTVEAMSSHRPYRAALGIDSALAEIERGRGSVYDAAAVDTCLKLFREKRFAFST